MTRGGRIFVLVVSSILGVISAVSANDERSFGISFAILAAGGFVGFAVLEMGPQRDTGASHKEK